MTFEHWLQWQLVTAGFNITVDGDIGRATMAALREYQRQKQLPITGVADEATIKALRSGGGLAVVRPPVAQTVPPWMYELIRRMGLHEVRDKQELVEFLKIGKFLGDPAKLPWCGDAMESAFAKTLPDEPLPTNAFFAQNWKNFGHAVDPMVGCVGVIRWSPNAGHVGTVSQVTATRIGMVGGNQSNAITNAWFPRTAFIAFRWPNTFPVTEYPPFKGATIDGGGVVATR